MKPLRPRIDLLVSWVLGVSIRVKVMGITLGVVCLLSLAIATQVRSVFVHTLMHKLDVDGVARARHLAARASNLILTNNLYALDDLIFKAVELGQSTRYVLVLDPRGEVLAHTFRGRVPPDLLRINRPAGHPAEVLLLDTDEGPVHDIRVPVLEGRAGWLRLGLTEERLWQSVRSLMWRLLLITIAVGLAGALAALLLTHLITRPLRALADASLAVSRGEFRRPPLTAGGDEVGRLSAAFNAMMAGLERGDRENERLLEELRRKEVIRVGLLDKVIRAQEDERRRVARELHDGTGQNLTSVMLELRAMEEAMERCSVCPGIERIQGHVAQVRAVALLALDEVRRLARDLRPAILDDLGLPAALDRCVGDFSRMAGIPVDYHVVGLEDVRFLPQVEAALFRIVQEALTNVARHAGARSVSVALESHNGNVHVIVEDDGMGFDPSAAMAPGQQETFGLLGMQERAALVGGKLTVESMPGYGTTLFVTVPLSECLQGERHEQDPGSVGG